MNRIPLTLRPVHAIAALLAPVLLGAATPAAAVAMFGSTAEVLIRITDVAPVGVAGFAIDGGGTVTLQSATPSGTATGSALAGATPMGGTALGPGDDVTLEADTSGSALAPGDSVLADTAVEGSIVFDNGSGETVAITLALSATLTAMAAVDDPLGEVASALATLFVVSDSQGTLVFEEAFADSMFGPPQDEFIRPLTTLFQFALAPGQSETLTLSLASGGFAESAAAGLPEPASALLLVAALGAAGWRRRR